MTKRVKTTHSEENKNRRVKIPAYICIILLTSLLLISYVNAEYIEKAYDVRNINYFRMYGYDSTLTDQAWRSYTTITDGNQSFHTNDVLYGQYGQRFNITTTSATVHQIDYNFTMYVKYSNTSTLTKAVYVNTTATANQIGIPTVTVTGNTRLIGNDTYNEITISGSHYFNDRTVTNITIQTNVQFVSSAIYVEKFLIVVNNEIAYQIGELKDVSDEISGLVDEMTVPYPDINEVVNIIDGNLPTMDINYQTIILSFSSHYIVATILAMVIALALLSYIVYGRKT